MTTKVSNSLPEKNRDDDSLKAANIGAPRYSEEQLERMQKRRFQSPKPQLYGNFWCIRPWNNGIGAERKRLFIKLAPADTPLPQVKKLAQQAMCELNHQPLITSRRGLTLEDYLAETYYRDVLSLRPKSVRQTYSALIEKHIVPVFGKKTLQELNPLNLQRFFSQLPSKGVNHPTVVKLRDALSHVLRSAKRFHKIAANPLAEIELPRDERGELDKPMISPVEFQQLMQLLDEPFSTMLLVAVFSGLRISEIAALRWKNIGPNSITVKQRFSRGEWGSTKTKGSAATIAVEPFVIERIHELKTKTVRIRAGLGTREHRIVKDSSPEALVFQSFTSAAKPMNAANILKRYLKPVAEKLGVRLHWRACRTTTATWMVASGADLKAVQGQMRHSHVSTTLGIYAQIVQRSQNRAAEQMREYYDQSLREAGFVQLCPNRVQ